MVNFPVSWIWQIDIKSNILYHFFLLFNFRMLNSINIINRSWRNTDRNIGHFFIIEMTFPPGKESISNKKAHGDQTGWRGWVSPEGIWRDQKVAKDGRDEEQGWQDQWVKNCGLRRHYLEWKYGNAVLGEIFVSNVQYNTWILRLNSHRICNFHSFINAAFWMN